MFITESGMQGLGRRKSSFFKKIAKKSIGHKILTKSPGFKLTKKILKKSPGHKLAKKITKSKIKMGRKAFLLPVKMTKSVFKSITGKKRRVNVPAAMQSPELVAEAPVDIVENAQAHYQDPEPDYQEPEPNREDQDVEQDDEQDQEPESDFDEYGAIPFATGEDSNDEHVDGLGKKLWKQKKFRKTFRKVALVAGTAAALYFTGGAAAGLLKKGMKPKVGDSSPDYQPEPEYGNTTGYEGSESATVPGGPSLFERATNLVPFDKRPRSVRSQVPMQAGAQLTSSGFGSDLLSGKNVVLLGGAGVLALTLYYMTKGKRR